MDPVASSFLHSSLAFQNDFSQKNSTLTLSYFSTQFFEKNMPWLLKCLEFLAFCRKKIVEKFDSHEMPVKLTGRFYPFTQTLDSPHSQVAGPTHPFFSEKPTDVTMGNPDFTWVWAIYYKSLTWIKAFSLGLWATPLQLLKGWPSTWIKAILGIGFPYYSLPFGVTNRPGKVAINGLDGFSSKGSSRSHKLIHGWCSIFLHWSW